MKITIKSNAKEIIRKLESFEVVAKDETEQELQEIMSILQDAIKSYTPIGAGPTHLKDNINVSITGNKRFISAKVSTSLRYGVPVELGSRPRSVPVNKLVDWVEAKLGISGNEATSVAWAIRTKIKRSGTKGAHMFEKGWREQEAKILDMLKTIPINIIKELEMRK